jgi:hypothetical protein
MKHKDYREVRVLGFPHSQLFRLGDILWGGVKETQTVLDTRLNIEIQVTLRLTVSQSVCLGVEPTLGLATRRLLSESCGVVSVGRPLWREDGSAICSVITQWSESLKTRRHTLLSHLRPLQPGGPGSRIYIPQEEAGPVLVSKGS